MFRVAIIDDEPPARKKIRKFLEGDDHFTIVGEAGGATSAIPLIEREQPDLLFLDIQMPGMNGFELLANLEMEKLPRVIFSTAYDNYALEAFEIHALDYLLKPFDITRFRKALDRAADELEKHTDQSAPMKAMLSELGKKGVQRLLLREGGKIFSVRTSEIICIKAEEKYVRIQTQTRAYLHRATLAGIEAKLDPEVFVRIHRSAIINLDCFEQMEPAFHGDHVVLLNDGSKQKLGRNYKEHFLNRLEGGT